MNAFGVSGTIVALRVKLSGAARTDTTLQVSPPRRQLAGATQVRLPQLFLDTVLTAEVRAIDDGGRTGPAASTPVPIRIGAPQVLGLGLPATARPGQTIDFAVDAASARGIDRIVLQYRGDVTSDDELAVAPASPHVVQDVSFVVPAAIPGPLLIVRALAYDRSGARAILEDTVAVDVSAPRILSVTVPDAVPAGGVLDVRVRAAGARNIAAIAVGVRGAFADDEQVQVAPAASDVTRDFAIAVPDSVSQGAATIRVTATDAAGVLSAVYTVDVGISRDSTAAGAAPLAPNASAAGPRPATPCVSDADAATRANAACASPEAAAVRGQDARLRGAPPGRARAAPPGRRAPLAAAAAGQRAAPPGI